MKQIPYIFSTNENGLVLMIHVTRCSLHQDRCPRTTDCSPSLWLSCISITRFGHPLIQNIFLIMIVDCKCPVIPCCPQIQAPYCTQIFGLKMLLWQFTNLDISNVYHCFLLFSLRHDISVAQSLKHNRQLRAHHSCLEFYLGFPGFSCQDFGLKQEATCSIIVCCASYAQT